MIEYIYFVKCPNCEDEHFSFFKDAKNFALGCLSQKPIITQTEVDRNDFGECTDSCDLGTVWSWEDVMQDTEEPTGTVFSKDDLKCTEYDPEFDALDNSVDFEIDEIPDNFRKPITEAKTGSLESAIYEALDYLNEFSDIFPFPANIMGDSWEDLKDGIRYGVSSTFEIAEIILEYLDKDLAIGRKHPEIFEDDPQSELTLETYNKLQRAFDRAVAEESIDESCCKKSIIENTDRKLKTWICFYDGNDVGTVEAYDEYEAMSKFEDQYADECFFDSWDHDWQVEEAGEDYVAVDESCKRKPIPEGMTIEQLVEEMEENEDDVECSLCNELFPKTECYYDEDEGYICPDCKEENVKCTWCGMYYDPSECRKEVDLGWLCDRCEAAIKSRGETLTFIEGNSWDLLDENVKLKETFAPDEKVDFEYTDLEVTLQGAKRDVDDWDEEDVKVDYTYSADKNDVATDIWENFITEEDVVDSGGFEVLEDNATWEKFLETHFDELVEKYYAQLLEYYRAAATKEYEEKHSLEDYYDDLAWDHADAAVNDILADRFS